MSLGQILEPSFAVEDGFFGSGELLNRFLQVPVVVHDLEFHCADESRVSGERGCGLCPISLTGYQSLKTEPLQPLRDGGAIPTQRLGGRLHIETLLPEYVQDRRIAGRFRHQSAYSRKLGLRHPIR